MGRRPETEDVLSDILGRLSIGRRNGRMAYLFGARGNGKTVLLQWLHAEATAANVATVALLPEHLDSPAGLTEAVRDASRRFPKLGAWVSTVETGVGGLGVGLAGDDATLLLANLLNHGDDGLLVTLDEAHETSPDNLGRILNATQLAGRNRPVAVMFAGTPGLEANLRDSRASFWSRGEKLRVGLLEDDSARAVLARPFQDAGLEADDEAVADLARATDNYPYFLQHYGRAAWQVVEESGGRAFLPEHAAPARAAADRARQAYYLDRYNEFRNAGLLPLARQVAEAFIENATAPEDLRLPDYALNALLPSEGGRGHKAFLISTGYIWPDGSGNPSWAPCLPSLIDYMLENIPAP